MAVAHDAAAESHTGTSGSASQASFSWTQTPVGTPAGILVFVVNLDSTTGITSAVDWGGAQLAMSTNGVAVDTVGEIGRCAAWFLGNPTTIAGRANNTVTVTRTNNTNVMYAVSATVTAAAGQHTAIHEPGVVLLQEDGTLAVQSVTDGGAAVASQRYAGGMTGLQTVPTTAGTGSTFLFGIDIGAQGAIACRETTAGTGARNVGFTNATSDDRAIVHLAIKEIPPPTGLAPYQTAHRVLNQAMERSSFR